MTPVIEALAEYKHSPSDKSLQALKAARSKVQQTARRCASEYWQQLSDDIQTAAVTDNIRGLPSGTFNSGIDIPPSTTGEVQRVTEVPLDAPQKLHSMIRSFHDDMKAAIQYEGSMTEPFDLKSGVKQGYVLVPTLFGIFSLLLKHAFGTSTEGE
ncbi:hypothetical protein ACOMHN_065161 [Nucella lapillus]